MSTTDQSRFRISVPGYERRGEVVQIGALMPTILERYELRFPSPQVSHASSADVVSGGEATSNPPTDGLPCV